MAAGTEDAPIYFKHLYGANPHEWGAIGFPTTQRPTTALRNYRAGGLVLLAVTRNPDTYPELVRGYEGTIFGVCTLLHLDGTTAELAKPEMAERFPRVIERWPRARPLDRMWLFDKPKTYDDFAGGQLTQLATNRRGQMIRLADYPNIELDIRQWLYSAPRKELKVYRSDRTLRFLALRR